MAMVASSFIELLVGRVVSLVEGEVILLFGAKNELKKLRKRLVDIQLVVEDAEGRQFSDRAVRLWLADLKQIMYEADDIIDLCNIKTTKKQALLDSYVCSVPKKIVFLYSCGKKVRNINSRLEENIKNRVVDLQLMPSRPRDAVPKRRWRETSSVMVDLDVVGIDEDVTTLVTLLTTRVGEGNPNPSAFAITGMGGIGKTTLAQKIFNHSLIEPHFDVKIWVCVSQDFDEVNLLKQIVRCSGGTSGDAQTRAELEPLLRRLLAKRKFLLVLDDIWSDRVWNGLLRAALQGIGARGSEILITTRNEQVVGQIGVVYCHKMKLMSNQNCWLMLRKIVFQEEEDEEEVEKLKDVGGRIVEKCAGLPLAVKVIGGVLRTKGKNVLEWEKVQNSQIWKSTGLPDGISSSLYLSYEDLSSQLKQCFVFCSLFPEDFLIPVWIAVQMWIAEGYVKVESDEVSDLEDVAEDYYWELVERGLLQIEPRFFSIGMSRMHDLLRSLALSLANNDHFFGDLQKSPDVSERRHISIVDKNEALISTIVKTNGLKFARTLFLHGRDLNRALLEKILHQFKHLRVLDLQKTRIDCLPDSVGDLLQLRFLDLSSSTINELPESICRIPRLQALLLHDCSNLRFLPEGIVLLNNLSYLSLDETPLRYIPHGLGRMTKLSSLLGFIIGSEDESVKAKQNSSKMDELKHLTNLRYLNIYRLERVSNAGEAKAAALWEKNKLRYLVLGCERRDFDDDQSWEKDINTIEEVFEEIRPPLTLEDLFLDGFYGRRFPTWISTRSLPYLKLLLLNRCILCEKLPYLERMVELEFMHVSMPKLTTVDSTIFTGNGRFPKLKALHFIDMEEWEEWEEWEDGILPSLKLLALKNCPRLKSFPTSLQLAVVLTELTIENAGKFMVIENLRTVEKVSISHMPNLVRMSNLPALFHLKIIECPKLEEVENLGSLKHLELEDSEMEILPRWLRQLSSLKELYIIGKVSLRHRCVRGGEDWFKIQHIPLVVFKPISSS